MKSSFTSSDSIYSRVTDIIISAIEAGASSFEMPWHRKADAGMPRNPLSKNVYQGVNTLSLWAGAYKKGYASSYWATYWQWRKLSAQVREGEKGSPVVFYKREDVYTGNEEGASIPRAYLRYSFVFNADRVDGWKPDGLINDNEQVAFPSVDAFIKALGSDTRYGSDSAYYNWDLDRIFIPDRQAFRDTKSSTADESFYAVLLHEHIHWSGHRLRLNRDFSERFGSESYAMEELVAELGSAFLCTSLGLSAEPRPDHAAYIATWLQVLKSDKAAIFAAASTARKASDYLETLARLKMRE